MTDYWLRIFENAPFIAGMVSNGGRLKPIVDWKSLIVSVASAIIVAIASGIASAYVTTARLEERFVSMSARLDRMDKHIDTVEQNGLRQLEKHEDSAVRRFESQEKLIIDHLKDVGNGKVRR